MPDATPIPSAAHSGTQQSARSDAVQPQQPRDALPRSDDRNMAAERQELDQGRAGQRSGDSRTYKIVHGAVGGIPTYTQGEIVRGSVFADPERLVELGAIVEATEATPKWTLYQAMRSESPPTLPNAPFVDATDREKLVAAGALPLDMLREDELPHR